MFVTSLNKESDTYALVELPVAAARHGRLITAVHAGNVVALIVIII